MRIREYECSSKRRVEMLYDNLRSQNGDEIKFEKKEKEKTNNGFVSLSWR